MTGRLDGCSIALLENGFMAVIMTRRQCPSERPVNTGCIRMQKILPIGRITGDFIFR
jgi:hypothetical protein